MAIKFRCPTCRKALSTGDDKAGRTATCPQCGSSVTVPQPEPIRFEEAAADDGFGDFNAPPPRQRRETRQPRQTGDINCPACGVENHAGAVFCRACGEPLTSRVAVRRPGGSLEFGDIFKHAFECWKGELGVLVGGFLVAGFMANVAGAPLKIVSEFMKRGNVTPLLILLACLAFVLQLIVQIYVMLGMARVVLSAARGESVSVGDIFAQGQRLPTALLNALLISPFFFLPLFVGFALILFGIEGRGDPGLALMWICLGILIMMLSYIVPLLFWPAAFLVVDGATGLTPLTRGFALVWARPGLTGLLGLAGFLLHVVGLLMCCIGGLFSSPLSLIMFAVAYDRLQARVLSAEPSASGGRAAS